ncbi:hypothetical protein [Micromonospora sp. NPDC047134]|uniref:hypothetical protein n=1 Tax=Micromonospora sp. NPDC047134 TaxID=3154340 RepID=UPI0033FA5CD5
MAIERAARLGDAPGIPSRTELAAGLAGAYRHTARDAEELPITGGPDEAAERLAEYAAHGANHVVIGLSGPDWRAQVDLLAEVRRRLPQGGE